MKQLKLLLIGLLFLAACSESNRPSDVALKGSEYLKNKQFDRFATLIAYDKEKDGKDVKQQQVLMAALLSEKYSKMVEQNGGIKDITILSEKVSADGNSATIDIEYLYGDGSKDTSSTDLVKQNDEWKIKVTK